MTYCLTLGDFYWWARQGSNLRPTGYEPVALTTELRARDEDESVAVLQVENC
jgi:hypothetical protein